MNTHVKLNNAKCLECDNVKMFGIDIDSNVNKYVSSICTKPGR